MVTYVLGDLHGRYAALVEVLSRSRFNKETDTLILLGDICDGGPDTKKCMELLSNLPNIFLVLGNHDQWFLEYITTGKQNPLWISQGGAATLSSYGAIPENPDDWEYTTWKGAKIPESHKKFLQQGNYYLEKEHMLFVHGGIHPSTPLALQDPQKLMWDRSLALGIEHGKDYGTYGLINSYDHIFIGHTAIKEPWLPITHGRITNIDTGAGWFGKLTLMNIHTKEFWQSTNTGDVWRYPHV